MKNEVNAQVARELCEDPDVRRIAHYASSKFFSSADGYYTYLSSQPRTLLVRQSFSER